MLNPWYITGFCDGEAAFTYSRTNGAFGLYFSIKQRDDNKQIIEDIRAHFDYIGSIYQAKEAQPTKNSGFTKPAAYYRVTKISELQSIVRHFDKYPLQSAKKLAAYNIWRDMVIYKFENYRKIDYMHLKSLAEKLSSLNMQSRAFKIHTR